MKTRIISIPQQQFKAVLFFTLTVVVATLVNELHAQEGERVVTGVVTTYDGPLPNASVMLKGTFTGVTTDEDGYFTFSKKLKKNDILVVSSLAYDSYEITIDDDTTFVEPYLEGSPLIIVGALRTASLRNQKDSIRL